MVKGKITEIFDSIQGEGKYLGVDQIFVRFFDCNLKCVFCDTPLSNGSAQKSCKEYQVKDVIDKIKKLNLNCHSLSLTGGEPLLQKDFIKMLIPEIKLLKLPVYLETNGTLVNELKDVIDKIDIISMDMKLPSSAKIEARWDEHEEFLKAAREKKIFVKIVITKDTTLSDVNKAVRIVAGIDPKITFVLQPNSFDKPSNLLKMCRKFQAHCFEYLVDVRIIPQMHKVWGVR